MVIKFKWPEPTLLKSLAYYLLVIGTPLTFFAWHLGSQTAGLSATEAASRSAAKLSNISENPLFAPYKLLENILYHLGSGSFFAMRLTSVIFALVIVAIFFYLLKIWFGKPIALLTVLLLALTPLFILSARTATPLIMYAFPVTILFAYHLIKRYESSLKATLIFIFIVAINLYIPGFIWLAIISSIFWYSQIRELILKDRTYVYAGLLILLILLLSPLAYAFINNPSLFRQWLLIPEKFPSVIDFIKNFVWLIFDLFIKLRTTENLSIEKLPVLNTVQLGLFVFGMYVIWIRLRKQFYWISATVLSILLLGALSNKFELLIFTLPFVAFVCGMGLRYLFIEWRKVFPINPLAKAFAIALMFSIITIHIFYGVRYSLLAWPASSHVKKTYMLK